MREEKNLVVHDSVTDMFNKFFEIFKGIGGKLSWYETLLEYLILALPLAFFIVDRFKWKFSFVILIAFLIAVFIYYSVRNFRISDYYIKTLGLKPSKYNIFVSFYIECKKNKIGLSEIEEFCDYLDVDMATKSLNDFAFPMILTIILTLCINQIDKLVFTIVNSKTTESYSFVISLLIYIYLFIWFQSTLKSRDLLLLKKCLVYTKIKYKIGIK